MIHLLFVLSVVALLPICVSAHGYIGSVTIDGKSYPGNEPGGTANPSVIRQVSTISPVKGADNPSINCGMNATLAANAASCNPGSQIAVDWVGGATGDSHWPHDVGPIMHYMAKCTGSCSSYDSTNAEWFKISELGLEPDNSTWYQGNIAKGMPANVTIPDSISSGDYLLRSEIISLQLGMTVGGAEFYPGCIQLSIGGSGSGGAKSSEECTFPGCYSDTDPGIYDPNIYNPPLAYTFPGPAVAEFVGSGASQGGTQPSGSVGGSSATPTTGSPAASGSSVPANASSSSSSPIPISSSPTDTTTPTMAPSPAPSGNSTGSGLGVKCSVKPRPTDQLLAKRMETKMGLHKRRLVRRGQY